MPPEETLSRRVIIEGFVQGVGYRYFAFHAARRLNLSGWVRNRANGTVEALISGPPQAIEAMLAELRRGPPGARVRSVVPAEAVGAEWTTGTFEIRPSA